MTNNEYSQLVEFLGRQFTAIDQQFTMIDQRFATMDQRFTMIDQRFATMDRRFDELRDHVDERFREVFGHFDAIYHLLERLEQEYQASLQALRRIEAILADERGRREIVERGLAELKEHVAVLTARIDELERRLRS